MRYAQFEIELLVKIKTPLVNKFYDLNRVKGRANKQDDVWVVRNHSEIIAACRVQTIASHLFLSTLFVLPQMRNEGVARDLLLYLIEYYRNKSLLPIFTFAYSTLDSFYNSLGFNACQNLPIELKCMFESYQLQGRKIIPMYT
ncbi:GNAT family N-acetyltransferase [Pseudoalteromonas denitrificans]|uniref:Acetyltransferase (GNAT) domain-containing protein n=1 Tax=Pseudoalteromonas denitrificans DSM 6059 TaxID=1123010 RepID=A0A1I1E954_9GAMM|nr:GNAT family N-acetyltransferase [Pseudoalteromonas denitrificans]SFB83132.1 Acetyltransferase (GNAT) domain-containing protein [Pseudoalteromonas denitrificans DSM 6059]